MNSKLTGLILLILLVFSQPASAWGVLGHRVTGAIADHYLTSKARLEIKKLLGNESVAMVSNYADFIKSNRAYDSLGPWHYVNLKPEMSEQEVYRFLDTDRNVDLYTKMNFLIRELKGKKLPRDRQIFYLKLLIHFVGDAHQPMHTGKPDDRGGNDIKVYWFKEPTNLHRVWDEHLIDFQQLSYTEHAAAINFPTRLQRDKWLKQPIKEWIYESYVAAQRLYAEVKPEDKLSYNYNYKNESLLNEQLLKGGIRLAAVLNEIFGK